MHVVHTPTQEEYDELMNILDKKGGYWGDGDKMKKHDTWKHYGKKTCIDVDDITSIMYSPISFFEDKGYKILSLNDYKKMNDIPVCEFKRGDVILVRNNELKEYEEAIFLAQIKGGLYPYICVIDICEEDFTTGKTFGFTTWKYAKQKPKTSPEEIENAKKLLIEIGEKWSTY